MLANPFAGLKLIIVQYSAVMRIQYELERMLPSQVSICLGMGMFAENLS
jgi:hypothetical protein